MSRTRRGAPLAAWLALLVLGCAGGSTSAGTETTVDRTTGGTAERRRPELGCTERPAGGEDACRARGCDWTQPLSCYGTEPPPDEVESERRAREAGTMTCTCVCAQDVEDCSMVPSAPPAD